MPQHGNDDRPPSAERKRPPVAFVLLCATGLLAIFSSTMSKSPVLPLFAEHLGARDAGLGLIAAASTYTGILLSIPGGVLSDRLGRRPVLLASGFVFASAPLLYLLVHTPGALAAVRAYHGVATAVFGPVAMAYVAELAPVRRGERMGLFSSATLVGRSLAPLVGGLLLAYGFSAVYVGCALAAVLALPTAWALPRCRDQRDEGRSTLKSTWQNAREGFLLAVRNRAILCASGAEAVTYLCFGAVETFLPLYAVKHGVTKWQIGAIFAAQIITVALTKPLLGGLSDRVGRPPVIAGGLLVGAAALVGLSLATGVWTLGAATAAFGLALSAVTSATSAFVSDVSRTHHFGVALGVLSTIMDIGHSTGPVLAGALVGLWAYQAAFRLIAILPTLAAVVTLLTLRGTAAPPTQEEE